MKFFWQWRELYKRKEAECIWKEKAFDDLMFISKTNEQRSKKAEAEMRLLRTVNDSLRKRIDGLLDVRVELETEIEQLKQHVRYYKRDELGRFM